jgi:DNA-binding IclR family transcriptional regulator
MTEVALTQKQAHFRRVFSRFVRKHGYTPTVREIAEHMNMHPAQAHRYMTALVERGAATRQLGKAASFKLI